MHRTGSALLVVALAATAVGGVAFATTPRPDAPLAAAAAEQTDPTPTPSAPPTPASADVDLSAPWRGPVNGVLAGITEDFPDDVAEAWLEGGVATVAFSDAAPAEVVERLRALERPFAVQEGLGISSVQLGEVVGALGERTLVVAPDRTFAISASVRERTFTVEIGASSDPAASGGTDLGVDVEELEDRIRAGIPAADLAGFDIVVTIDPSFTIGH